MFKNKSICSIAIDKETNSVFIGGWSTNEIYHCDLDTLKEKGKNINNNNQWNDLELI